MSAPHTHGGTDAPECTTCTPAPLTGTCPNCTNIFNLMENGTLRLHNRADGSLCSGSGLKPPPPRELQWGWISYGS